MSAASLPRTPVLLLTLCIALAIVGTPTPARAAHPGPAGQVAYEQNDLTIRVLNDNGVTTIADPTGAGLIPSEPSFSPDGTLLAFALQGNRSEIWTVDLSTGQFFQLSTQPQIPSVESPSFTRDGQVVFIGIDNADGVPKWFSAPGRGGAAPVAIATPADVPSQPNVSPAGGEIAYWDERDDRIRLFTPADGQSRTIFTTGDAGVTGGQRTQDTNQDGSPYSNLLDLNWHPSGTSLLFDCNTGDDLNQVNQVCEVSADGQAVRVVSEGTASASGSAYSPAGDEIYYADFDQVNGVIVAPRIYKVPAANPARANRVLVSPADANSTTHTRPDVGVPIGTAPPSGSGGSSGSDETGGSTTATPATSGAVFAQDPSITTVIDASDPVDAAVQVSRLRFPGGGTPFAVLSRDDTFADSLAGTSLTIESPLLLTSSDGLDSSVADELRRVVAAGGTVYLLGGEQALSRAVESDVAGLGFSPQRLAGEGRIETAVAIATETVRRYPAAAGTSALVARAGSPANNPTAAWADSVAAGSVSAFGALPLLLTNSSSLHPAVEQWLEDNQTQTTYVLGGEAALVPSVLAGVPNGRRISGADRTATAAAIAREFWAFDPQGVRAFVLINGEAEDGWAYGLPAAGLGADLQVATLLVGRTVSAATTELIGTCGQPQVRTLVVGSTAVVGQDVVDEVNRVDGSAC